jgi:hypothetical protein
LLLLALRSNQAMHLEPEALALLGLAKLELAKSILQEVNPRRRAMQFEQANPRLLVAAEQGWPQARFLLLLARARRYSQGPGPCAFFREKLVARKCNRAVCSGGLPIFVQCRQQRNRRGFAGYDNKSSRSQRKHGHPAEPSLIAAADKRRCRPLPFAD